MSLVSASAAGVGSDHAISARDAVQASRHAEAARIVLLGVGHVGSALLKRLDRLQTAASGPRVRLVGVSDSRRHLASEAGLGLGESRARLAGHEAQTGAIDPVAALGDEGTRIVVDATASDAVAARHAGWLARGIHVVTACKLGCGGPLARWREIDAARAIGGARYGDAATVGAGLPLLRSLRELRAGGDRIRAIAGVLSGSLAWLFANFDGTRPFSTLVREAVEAGYTEPDPREDLSGADVRRKLLILARAAGHALEEHEVEVQSLVPTALAILSRAEAHEALDVLDAPLAERARRARSAGRRLRFVARFGDGRAQVGLEALAPEDPLAVGGGCDNRVAIHSDRYCDRPLLIQGPGAGADVTAAAVLDDVYSIIASAGRVSIAAH